MKEIAEKSACLVMITVTTLDEAVRSAFEPGAPSSAKRLETVKTLTRAGIDVGVLAMPLLPELGDAEDRTAELFLAAKEAGAVFVTPGGLTLRPGRQKDLFLSALAAFDPGLVERYRELYAEERASGSPLNSYTAGLRRLWKKQLDELFLPFLIPQAVHRKLLSAPDSVRVLLRHMVELYAARGVSTAALRDAGDRYDLWLAGERTTFRRGRSLPRGWLDDRYDLALSSGEMDRVLANPRLAAFLKRLRKENLAFDYRDLKSRLV